nr:unnamed protein product [Spirometra erinaceieuropaei]
MFLPLLVHVQAGKPVSQRIEAPVFSGSSGSGRTFCFCNSVTHRRFLVDTGVQISVVPPPLSDCCFPSSGLYLQAVNSSTILTFGSLSLTLDIDLRRSFFGVFVVADVPHAILGSDFLAKFDLLVDCRRSRLLDRTTGLSVHSLTPFTTFSNLSVLDTRTACPYRGLLLQHPNPQFRSGEVQHDVVHYIRISGPPVFAQPRRQAPARLQAAKAEFEHGLQLGIIRPPERLHQSSFWRNGVLLRAFHQILVAPEDIPKAAVATPYGLFELIRILFGLHNATQTFQMFTDYVLRGLPFVYTLTDDLIVASQNAEEHKEHLALVFSRLGTFGVIISSSKCVLGVPSLEFLGHHVDSEGLRPLSSKIEAVRNFPPPTAKRQLQRFLGMVSFYRRFLPNCADLMLPLTNMLSGPKDTLKLTDEALTAFKRISNSLADATLLTQPAPESQLPPRIGRDFAIFTDYKPLTFALRSHSDKYNSGEIVHVNYISQFDTDIRHIDGTQNEVADMLSGPSLSSLQLSHGVDLGFMAAEQKESVVLATSPFMVPNSKRLF